MSNIKRYPPVSDSQLMVAWETVYIIRVSSGTGLNYAMDRCLFIFAAQSLASKETRDDDWFYSSSVCQPVNEAAVGFRVSYWNEQHWFSRER